MPQSCNRAYAGIPALLSNTLIIFITVAVLSGCVALLLNGHLSFDHYEAKSGTFKCRLPGGALSTKLKIIDRSNEIGETATFSLDLGLLWRIDHLLIGKHKLAMLENIQDKRQQLEQAKDNYINIYLNENTDLVEVKWESFTTVNNVEVLLANTYIKWNNKEEIRELLFSIDGDYLNVIHYAQNVSDELQSITSGAKGFYKSCTFN
jgi:hypothetical protein